MRKPSKILHHNYNDLKLIIRSGIGVCLGIFLFLLFFQPFEPQTIEFNSKLLVLAGFGGITLILLAIMRLLLPALLPGIFLTDKWNTTKESYYDFIFVVLNTVAYSFFARYVGKVAINFHVVTILSIISIAAIVIMVVTSNYHHLKQQVLAPYKEADSEETIDPKNTEVVFESDNKSDFFKLYLEDLILIKSASNYVELVYKKEGEVQKRLLRSTMKTTEQLLKNYSDLIRCHRSCIVNKDYIKEVSKNGDGLVLELFDYSSKIHVSRQYVVKIKEAIKHS